MWKRVTIVVAMGVLMTGVRPGSSTEPAPEPAPKVAPAKAAPLNGTVVSVSGVRVEIKVDGEKPAWVKRGSGIKVKGGLGKIVDVSSASVAFNTKKASTIEVGEKLVVDKGTVVPAGC